MVLLSCAPRPLEAQTRPSLKTAAARLQKTVVTLRVRHEQKEGQSAETASESESRITVCSGVLLENGRIATSMPLGKNYSSVHATLPGGEQAAARVRVVDEYSRLSLLKIDRADLERADWEGIPCAQTLPQVGDWLVSGAGWGAKKPVISFGLVSGRDVAVSQTTFPPLLRCDMRTAKTSSGAAVTDQNGQLVGIVVLTDRSGEFGGWTYAVPVAHVLRLSRTLDESNNQSSVVVLKRRRPIVGMVLDGDGSRVVVSRVREESPAFKAGIQVGDEIVAADKVKIRSVYQAVRPVLRKQPGDRVSFLVRREDRQLTIPVVLGGGVELPSTAPRRLSTLVQPKINVENLPQGGVRASSTTGEVREFGQTDFALPETQSPKTATDARKIQLLKRALDRYQTVVAELSRQLEKSEAEHKRAAARIEVLEKQLEERTSNGNSH